MCTVARIQQSNKERNIEKDKITFADVKQKRTIRIIAKV